MDINRLLKKKGWTGEEAGKALILDLINSYKQNLAGNMNPKPLFPMERIAEMLHALRDSRTDIEAYNRYVHLQNWILQYQAVANANLQRYNSSFNEFVRIHNAAEAAENEYRYIEQLPRIVTQKQYEELKVKSLEIEFEKYEDGTSLYADNLFELVIRLVSFYALELEDNPKKANPLKAVKKLYQKKPLENKGYILFYNEKMGEGYLQLPDGTRNDKVTPEEWKERLLFYSPDLQRLIAEAEEGYTGQPGSLSFERLTKAARAAHMGEPKPEEGRSVTTWHTYEEAQEGLTKWEFIRAGAAEDIAFSDCIPALDGDAHGKAFVADAEAFKKEFSELLEAILKALDGMGYTHEDKPISAIPLKEWEKTEFPWEELYNTDFPGFREELESDTHVFHGDERALLNGVAILRPTNYRNMKRKGLCAAIDEKGYFIEPDAKAMFSNMFGLDAYTPDNPESGDNIDRIERNRETLMESVRFVVSYDLSLELIAEEIGIPEFTLFKADGAHCLERVEALNSLFDLLYTHIAEISYKDEERKAAKLQALRDVFYPIDLDALKVSEGRKKEAAKMLEGLEAFGDGRTGTSPGWNFLALLSAPEGRADE